MSQTALIGEGLAGAGLDSSLQITFLDGVIESTPERSLERECAIYGLVGIYLAKKDPDAAFAVTALDPFYGQIRKQPSTDLAIARSYAQLGKNPLPPLERATKKSWS